jgi:hypothetical protein
MQLFIWPQYLVEPQYIEGYIISTLILVGFEVPTLLLLCNLVAHLRIETNNLINFELECT